eukprot:scaffold750_cov133-Skeletonema_dohrnii-CCMP3373.AAC.2
MLTPHRQWQKVPRHSSPIASMPMSVFSLQVKGFFLVSFRCKANLLSDVCAHKRRRLHFIAYGTEQTHIRTMRRQGDAAHLNVKL